jgi:parvulin-like peptidyl-prolyl isomerase
MKMKMKRIYGFFIFGFVAAAVGFAQSDLQPAAIVRLTKSEPITVKQYRTEVERYEIQAGRALNDSERRQILDVMINERLAMQAAERDKITITDNEVNQQIQTLKDQMRQSIGRAPTDAEFGTAIRNETGMELPAFREQLKRQLLVQKYLMEKKKDSFSGLKTPTNEEIQNTYNLMKSQLVRPETVRFSMIQVSFTDAISKVKAKELADKLVKEIGGDAAKFDEAVIKGQVPNSGYQAGDGGYLPRNPQAQQLVGTEFLNTAFTLKQGEVSRLMENTSAYQIIKITETYGQKNLELDDIFQLGTRTTVRDYIGNGLLQERQQALIQQASQELVTELRAGNSYQIMENNLSW